MAVVVKIERPSPGDELLISGAVKLDGKGFQLPPAKDPYEVLLKTDQGIFGPVIALSSEGSGVADGVTLKGEMHEHVVSLGGKPLVFGLESNLSS